MEKEKLIKQIENTDATHLTALLGSPVAHSMSPFLHNAAYEQLKMLDYKYIAIEADERFLPEAVEIIKKYNFKGFNLTMPDKEAIMKHCDDITTEAWLMRSVNTVKIEDGKLLGYNTDCHGFYASLLKNGMDYQNKKMVLLGSGGAARAVLAGAAFNNVSEIDIFARPGEKFDILCEFVQRIRNKGYDIDINVNDITYKDDLYESVRNTDILVNSTSVGMGHKTGGEEAETLVEDTSCFHKDLFVADVIYFPRQTKLLKDAEEQGLRTMNGLGMLFYQAALAFEIWHGRKMPENILGRTK